jgi:acetyl-CoA C-acetyltransferase
VTPALDPDRTPVLVAVGQAESRDHSLGPIELLERASREALDAAPGLAGAIERVTVVSILTRRAGPTPARDLASLLGLRAPTLETTSIGGNTPQAMVERAAGDIAASRLQATLIAGAEAVRVGRLREGAQTAPEPAPAAGAASARPVRPESSRPTGPVEPDPVVGEDRQDLSDEERAAGIFMPLFTYPMFESVLAVRAGRSPVEQRTFLGELMAPLTGVASRNGHAWFLGERTPAEISEPSAENRLVVVPYTKRMVAFLGGAQAAALVMTSLSRARELGLDAGAVFPWSAATAYDVWYPIARPDLGRAVGLELAAGEVLRAAGVGIDEVGLLDVYSCFPSAVQIGAVAIGAGERLKDPARLTLTGGLPYFGGPGNNYTTHSIAAAFDQLRAAPAGELALTTGVGWYLTKHSVGLYGNQPPPGGYRSPDLGPGQAAIDALAVPYVGAGTPIEHGAATVDASSVFYDRDGDPSAAPVIATLEDGRRVAAAADPAELAAVATEGAERWLVGARVTIHADANADQSPTYHVEARQPTGRVTAAAQPAR